MEATARHVDHFVNIRRLCIPTVHPDDLHHGPDPSNADHHDNRKGVAMRAMPVTIRTPGHFVERRRQISFEAQQIPSARALEEDESCFSNFWPNSYSRRDQQTSDADHPENSGAWPVRSPRASSAKSDSSDGSNRPKSSKHVDREFVNRKSRSPYNAYSRRMQQASSPDHQENFAAVPVRIQALAGPTDSTSSDETCPNSNDVDEIVNSKPRLPYRSLRMNASGPPRNSFSCRMQQVSNSDYGENFEAALVRGHRAAPADSASSNGNWPKSVHVDEVVSSKPWSAGRPTDL